MNSGNTSKKLITNGGDFASTGRIGISCGAIDTPFYQYRKKMEEKKE